MKNRIIHIKDQLSQSYWFIPSLMVFGGVMLSFAAIELDSRAGAEFAQTLGVYINTPEGARAVLSTIAGSTMTVVSLVFSLTMVVLSLAAAQYGPLILGSFMSDHSNQVVLGTFTMSFIYCLLVLRTIRDSESSLFIPHISTLIGVAMAVLNVAVLIYFIHHVSDSIKPSAITSRITDTMLHTIDHIFPAALGQNIPNHVSITEPEDMNEKAQPIRAEESGYLQMVDEDKLMSIAQQANIFLKMHVRPGDFIIRDSILGEIYPGDRMSDDLNSQIINTFIIGRSRTSTQDVRFLFEQLVEIAARALSPGMNDPFTASMCIDRLSQGLCRFASRELPSAYRFDEKQRLRITAIPTTFEDMLSLSFDQIRHYGGADVRIVKHIMTALQAVAECIDDQEQKETLHRYINMVWQECRQRLTAEWDRREAEKCYQLAIDTLNK